MFNTKIPEGTQHLNNQTSLDTLPNLDPLKAQTTTLESTCNIHRGSTNEKLPAPFIHTICFLCLPKKIGRYNIQGCKLFGLT